MSGFLKRFFGGLAPEPTDTVKLREDKFETARRNLQAMELKVFQGMESPEKTVRRADFRLFQFRRAQKHWMLRPSSEIRTLKLQRLEVAIEKWQRIRAAAETMLLEGK
jgi:hypothetical protein